MHYVDPANACPYLAVKVTIAGLGHNRSAQLLCRKLKQEQQPRPQVPESHQHKDKEMCSADLVAK